MIRGGFSTATALFLFYLYDRYASDFFDIVVTLNVKGVSASKKVTMIHAVWCFLLRVTFILLLLALRQRQGIDRLWNSVENAASRCHAPWNLFDFRLNSKSPKITRGIHNNDTQWRIGPITEIQRCYCDKITHEVTLNLIVDYTNCGKSTIRAL